MSEAIETTDVILFDHEEITTKYLPDKGFISHVVHKPVSSQILRNALTAGTEGLIKYSACKWLSDDRKNGPIEPADIEWGNENFYPVAIKGGWKYWAVVVPQEVINAGSLMPVIETLYGFGLRMMTFADDDEAIEWLDSME